MIPFHWIGREAKRLGRPIRVCEIGIAHGLMLKYMLHGLDHLGIAKQEIVDRWWGVDMHLMPEYLSELPYDTLVEANIEQNLERVNLECDVCVLLHVLEHLKQPELVLQNILRRLPTGALLVVGFPNHIHSTIGSREVYLRSHTNENGHVSALSARRFTQVALNHGCEVVDMRSAFFLRSSGSLFEDSQLWQRFNLAWGSLLPGWPGEFYAVIRKL